MSAYDVSLEMFSEKPHQETSGKLWNKPRFTDVVAGQVAVSVTESHESHLVSDDKDDICRLLGQKILDQLMKSGYMKHSVNYSHQESMMVHKLELSAVKQPQSTITNGFGDETVFVLGKQTFSMQELETAIKHKYPERFI